MGILDLIGSASQVAQCVVQGAQRAQDTVGAVQRIGIQALDFPATKKLNDKELVLLLALAALDSYTLAGDCKGKLRVITKQFQNLKHTNMLNNIQFGVYEIVGGRHIGKTILAYRGTDVSDEASAVTTLLQDASLGLPNVPYLGQPIKGAISTAVSVAQQHKPDLICGHSLGGLLAECVCSEMGLSGASFNAPGPWTQTPEHNLLSGDKYNGVQFEVHLTRNDPVSLFGSYLGPECSHVGSPVWHKGVGVGDIVANHRMELLLEELEGEQ